MPQIDASNVERFVGEQVEVFGRKHNKQKKNFCDRCEQKIDWEAMKDGKTD